MNIDCVAVFLQRCSSLCCCRVTNCFWCCHHVCFKREKRGNRLHKLHYMVVGLCGIFDQGGDDNHGK